MADGALALALSLARRLCLALRLESVGHSLHEITELRVGVYHCAMGVHLLQAPLVEDYLDTLAFLHKAGSQRGESGRCDYHV